MLNDIQPIPESLLVQYVVDLTSHPISWVLPNEQPNYAICKPRVLYHYHKIPQTTLLYHFFYLRPNNVVLYTIFSFLYSVAPFSLYKQFVFPWFVFVKIFSIASYLLKYPHISPLRPCYHGLSSINRNLMSLFSIAITCEYNRGKNK